MSGGRQLLGRRCRGRGGNNFGSFRARFSDHRCRRRVAGQIARCGWRGLGRVRTRIALISLLLLIVTWTLVATVISLIPRAAVAAIALLIALIAIVTLVATLIPVPAVLLLRRRLGWTLALKFLGRTLETAQLLAQRFNLAFIRRLLPFGFFKQLQQLVELIE